MEVDYIEKLREALCNELYNNPQKLQGKSLKSYIEKVVLTEVKKLNNLWKADSYKQIRNFFVNEDFIEIISNKDWKKDKPLAPEKKKLITISGVDEVTVFLFGERKPKSKKQDIFSLVLGYNGFLEFKRAVDKKISNGVKEVISKKEEIYNPIHHDAIKEFFSKPCYVYVYDEDLTVVNKKTSYKEYHYPNIDALVLRYNNGFFALENTEDENGDKRDDHKKGVMTWCAEVKNGMPDYNAFDIQFGESRTKLILRIHFPYKKYKEKKTFDLLLGAFLFADIKGNLATGSVVVSKVVTQENVSPYKYRFKAGNKQERRPPPDVQRFLFDRYRNWHKIPYDIMNLNSFNRWLQDTYREGYNRTNITLYDYLITYPSNGIEKSEDVLKIKGEILNLLKKPEVVYESKRDDIEEKNKNLLVKYIKEKFSAREEGKKIIVYPNPNVKRVHFDSINREFLELLSQTVNSIFIIPDDNFKQTSSIFTVIGYCIALKKRTFVFFQEGEKNTRPNILEKSEEKINLYVYSYKEVSEIPVILTKNFFKEQWNKYLEKKL